MNTTASRNYSTSNHTGETMDPIPKLNWGVAAIVIAGLALSGCSMLGDEREDTTQQSSNPRQLDIDGDFVFATAADDDSGNGTPAPTTGEAPDAGDLFTMTVEGSKVTVTRSSCTTDAEGVPTPTTDARQTAFGELGGAGSETAAAIEWLEGGAFTEDDKLELDVLSDGDMAKVGEKTFFAAAGTQGKALIDQFDSGCSATEDDEATETAEPTDPSPGGPSEDSQSSTAPTEAGEQ